MKNPMKRTKAIAIVCLFAIASLMVTGLVCGVSAGQGKQVSEATQLVIAGGLFAGQCFLRFTEAGKRLSHPVQHARGVMTAGIDQEMWADRIIDPWFADNSVLGKVKRIDDQYILGGSVVHIPQAGSNPAVVKNRTVFPGVIAQRTDTDVSYTLDVYTTDPVHITAAEQMQISYNKMDSVLKNTKNALLTAATKEAIYAWAGVGAAQVIRTTGALITTNLPNATATGSRRQVTYADFVNAMNVFNGQDVPSEDRYCLMDAVQYGELLTDTEVTKLSIEKLADRAKGIVAELAGFKIMVRSSTVLFTNATPPVKKATNAADATTDNRSALFFHSDCLTAAMGDVKFFETIGSAEHYGDIYSALVKAGFRQERSDGKGVLSLVQAAS